MAEVLQWMATSSSGRTGKEGGVAVWLYFSEYFDVIELMARDDKVESSWVRIRGRANKADILVGVFYRLLNQDKETEEVFYEQLAEVASLPALVLMGDFNFPDICWEYNTTQKKQSRRFLKCL